MSDVFQPLAEDHTNLINNILSDFKYTVFLYTSKAKTMIDTLNKKHSYCFQNVHYIDISKIPYPDIRPVVPQLHWLNYTRVKFEFQCSKIRRKLKAYMITRLDIRCVESHAEVQNEFLNNSKKYVSF